MKNSPGREDRRVHRRTVLKSGGAVVGLGLMGASGASSVSATSSEMYRFLFQNAWLLNGILGNDTDIAKPELDERARGFGQRLRGSDLDIVGFCEVFASDQHEQIRGPVERDLAWEIGTPADTEKSSGLYTLTLGGHPIVERERYEFENDGDELRDADAWANKGVLFTRIELGGSAVDIFTTHLIAGGGLGDGHEDSKSPGAYRAEQLAETESFVGTTKDEYDPDREVPTILAGDFNVPASGDQFETLSAVVDRLGLYDAWERHGTGPGGTDREAITSGCAFDSEESPPAYCSGDGSAGGNRIDYLFLDEAGQLAVDCLRRRVFWRQRAPPDQFYVDDDEDEINYLADHVGLELDFSLD